MEVNAQDVIDSIVSKYSSSEAAKIKEIAFLEAQVRQLEARNKELEGENLNLSSEVRLMRESKEAGQAIEGDIVGEYV